MIDYKLAKQLKEAGFSQKGKGKFLIGRNNVELCKKCINGEMVKAGDDLYYIPTLSELIDACNSSSYFYLNREIWQDNDADDMEWTAECDGKEGAAISPKEAVAKLWLKLNK